MKCENYECEADRGYLEKYRNEYIKNAALLAAMLEVLQQTIEIAVNYASEARKQNTETVERYTWVQKARAVIFKAKGSQVMEEPSI